jgi:zinc D-Ala-D-Ala carboxypeptidase
VVRTVNYCVAAWMAASLALSAPAGGVESRRTLQRGDRGKRVLALQVRVAGWFPSQRQKHLRLDGRFGRRTWRAVKAFQRHYGLVVDGIAGPATFAVLGSLQDKNGSTAHFDWREFRQNYNRGCGAQANAYAGTFAGGMVSPQRTKRNVRRLMWRLEAIRAKGKSSPIGINSAFRSIKYNACIGGASQSQHLYGTAADNRMAGSSNHHERELARRSQMSGIGCYASLSHNHFDLRLDNGRLASARYWWWPARDRKGRDLDSSGRPCWGETAGARRASIRAADGRSWSPIPTPGEVNAFERAGEPRDLRAAD